MNEQFNYREYLYNSRKKVHDSLVGKDEKEAFAILNREQSIADRYMEHT